MNKLKLPPKQEYADIINRTELIWLEASRLPEIEQERYIKQSLRAQEIKAYFESLSHYQDLLTKEAEIAELKLDIENLKKQIRK